MQEIIREKVKLLLDSTKIGVSKDFTPEEKREFFDHYEQFGLSAPTCRNRFFRDGWHEWELKGILGCIIDFGKSRPEVEGIAIEAEKIGISDSIDSAYVLIQEFYNMLESKTGFQMYMKQLGMSRPTTTSHFNNPTQFAAWEVFGLVRITDA